MSRKAFGAEVQKWRRIGVDGRVDEGGRFFVRGKGRNVDMLDLSGVVICHAGVDTVRALYHGTVQGRWRDRLEGFSGGEVVRLGSQVFIFSRMGKASGYRYSFKAADLGVQVLVGSYYAQLDARGAHLKIELSPHYLQSRGVDVIQAALDALASHLLHDGRPSGVAVHLACDLQGWSPVDLSARMCTRARRSVDIAGISEVSFDLAEAAAVYGAGETYMLGLPNSVQMCLYDKTKQAIKIDKVDWWASIWDAYTFGAYRSGQAVWRLEMRFHHSVVRSLGLSQGAEWRTFADVVPYLTDLWRYALGLHRLNADGRAIDPYWQLMRDDVQFYHPPRGDNFRRHREQSTEAIEKNIQVFLGNLLSIVAKRGEDNEHLAAHRIVLALQPMSIWPVIVRYFQQRGMDASDVVMWIRDRLLERRLRGRAA